VNVTRRGLLKAAAAGGSAALLPRRASARERRAAVATSVGMLYDSTRCIGCRTCVSRCKEANELPYDRRAIDGVPYDAPQDLDGTTKNVIKVARAGDRSAFMKAQCMHCADPACVSVCMLGALHKEPRGVVGYDVSRCVGCRYCQVACPFGVPRFQWSSATPRIVKCELCRHRYADGKGAACAEASLA
jgi:Fe-S-cluster-containing dehydrogenase component